jgi:hypothetical protein
VHSSQMTAISREQRHEHQPLKCAFPDYAPKASIRRSEERMPFYCMAAPQYSGYGFCRGYRLDRHIRGLRWAPSSSLSA